MPSGAGVIIMIMLLEECILRICGIIAGQKFLSNEEAGQCFFSVEAWPAVAFPPAIHYPLLVLES